MEWIDGPLIQAMKQGAILLIDEINLASDNILERLNSVLEFEKTITLYEHTGEVIQAKEGFMVIATMNPGNEVGKRDLSPALYNRFTIINT